MNFRFDAHRSFQIGAASSLRRRYSIGIEMPRRSRHSRTQRPERSRSSSTAAQQARVDGVLPPV